MLTAREQFRHLVDRELGGRGLTRERRMMEALKARRCRNLFFNCVAPVVNANGTLLPADIIVQAQTRPFGAPVIVTDILNFDEVYRFGSFQGAVWELMRVFTSGIGAQSDFFGAGNFLDSLLMLSHYQSDATLNADAPSVKARFVPYLSPVGEIFQVNWELLDIGGPAGNVKTAVVAVGGAGYAVGDVLTLTTGGTGATVQVLTVDGGGAVLTVAILTTGTLYAAGASASAGGTGAGATFTITVTPTTTVRTQYNAEADFRAVQVLPEGDAYGQLCGKLYDEVCRYVGTSEPETFILDLEIPTASFPAHGLTGAFATELQARPLLIYGIATNINGAQITMRDQSVQWEFCVRPTTPTKFISAAGLNAGNYPALAGVPINVVAGNGDLTYHEAYNMLPVPHLLEPNTALVVRLTNGLRPDGITGVYTQFIDTVSNFGNSTGNGHIAFLCRTP